MANYNLTSQQLKDTYEQLVQVSGSAIVDGTGSLVNAFDYPSNSTYTTFSSSVATTLNSIVAGSGSADWVLITNKPAGLVSGSTQVNYLQLQNIPSGILSSSAQIATDISGAFTSTSASLASRITTNTSNIATKLNTSTFTSYSSSVSTRLTTDESNISTNSSNIATQTSRVNSLVSATSSYAVKSSNNVFSGTQTFNNIAVNGTASIAYLQSVTGSAKIIGDAFIILNNDTPTQPRGGMSVVDSGSTATTSSFLWDGVSNDWVYEYHLGGDHEQAVALFGSGSSIGNAVYPTANKLQKGTGTHHLHDSNISDDGSQVSITGPVSASTYYGDGSNLTGVQSGLVAGTGTDSLRSALTSTPAVAAADYSIAIGDNVNVESLSTGMIAIGRNINGTFTNRDYSIAIGAAVILENNGLESVAIGSSSRGEDYTVAVGPQASGTSYSVAVGKNARAGNDYSIAIGANANSTSVGTTPSTIAIGRDATANGLYGIALGYNTDAAQEGIAIGYNVDASARATAIGYNITNTGGGGNVAIGRTVTIAGDYSIAIGEGARAESNETISIGRNAQSYGNSTGTIVIGGGANSVDANRSNSVVIGYNAQGYQNCVAIGNNAFSIESAVAVGRNASTGDNQSVALGASAVTNNQRSIALGYNAVATGTDTIVIGTNKSVSSNNEINIGDRFKFDGTSTIGLIGQVSSSLGFVGNGSGLTNISSASYAQTSSFAAGNFEVAGQMFSPTFAGSVASSTSSIDFDNGNFATLSLTVPTFIANPSNLKSGTTYTIIISSGSLIANHGSAFKFAGGTSPTYSNGTDVLTMVSDGTNLYATALADFQ